MYADFTLRLLKEQFDIMGTDAQDLFGTVPPLPATEFFRTLLKRHLPLDT